jgi:hypothetical protein
LNISDHIQSLPSEGRNQLQVLRSSSYRQKTNDTGNQSLDEEEDQKIPAKCKKESIDTSDLIMQPVPKFDWWHQSRDRSPCPIRDVSLIDFDPSIISVGMPINENYDDSYDFDLDCPAVNLPSSEYRYEQDSQEFNRSFISITPGVELPLRGSIETQDALGRNYVVSVSCMECTLSMKCIRNAEYVICPLCHSISPLELSCSEIELSAFGVGLGYVDDL